MSHEADRIDQLGDRIDELENELTFEESELAQAASERDKYAAALFVARAWLQIQANRKGSLLFTAELRKATEIALEIIANPELCLKAHDEALDKEKDYKIRQLRNVLAEAARELLEYEPRRDGHAGEKSAFEIARFLGYQGNLGYIKVAAFLSSVSVSEPNA